MAIDGTGTYPSLVDVISVLDPQGNVAPVVELLQQSNPILLDMPWVEGNTNTGHQVNMRTGLPTAIFRSWYQGVPAGKSTYAKVTDACANIELRTEIDKDAADFNGNSAAFRLKEMLGAIEAMNQTMSTALFYGNASLNPTQFNGLSPRYSSKSAGNAQNIIDAGGTTNNANGSVWLIGWSGMTLHGIFPKGTKGGLSREDLGVFDAFDADRNRFRAVGDLLNWKCGLSVADWRYAVRIANIDMNKLETEQGAADLIKVMIKALHRIPNPGVVRTGQTDASGSNGAASIPMLPNPVFYCNRTIAEMLDIQSLNKTNFTLKSGSDVYGRPVTSCRGIPIRSCDALLENEGRVV